MEPQQLLPLLLLLLLPLPLPRKWTRRRWDIMMITKTLMIVVVILLFVDNKSIMMMMMMMNCCSCEALATSSRSSSGNNGDNNIVNINNNNSMKKGTLPPKKTNPNPNPTNPTTTIEVCTGPDCLVDGSSMALKQLQKQVSLYNNNNKINKKQQQLQQQQQQRSSSSSNNIIIKVKSRKCIGPCGDGPCAFILNGEGEKIVVKEATSQKKISYALVPPDIFGSDPKGWYQIRSSEQLNEVFNIAVKESSESSSLKDNKDDDNTLQQLILPPLSSFQDIQSNRKWYDRPRNERKVLQRFMQVSVLVGLSNYNTEYDGNNIGPVQIGIIAFILWGLSEMIMKENIFTLLQSIIKKKSKKEEEEIKK